MHPIAQFTGGAAILAAVAGLGAIGTHLGDEMMASTIPAASTSPAATLTINLASCVEDDPCWTWSKMGNRRRAVLDLSTGQRAIVGPCTFRHMWLNGNADLHTADQRMRGDWWAIHHGCEQPAARADRPAIHPSGLVEN